MTADERAGMDWWNGLSERERGQRLRLAVAFGNEATVAECWRESKIFATTAESCVADFNTARGIVEVLSATFGKER